MKKGDLIYWKDLDGNIHEEICLDIDDDVITIHIYPSGSSTFILTEDVLDPTSDEVIKFKREKRKEQFALVRAEIASFKDEFIHILQNNSYKTEEEIINLLLYGT